MTDAATDYTPHEDLPRLDRPVLLVALGGWIDAGGAANSAMDAIRSADPLAFCSRTSIAASPPA